MLAGLIQTYGLWALGALILLECAGIPLPGETALLLAAAGAATGLFPLWAVIVVAASAAIMGDSVGYWVGRRYGLPLLVKHGRWLRVTPEHVAHAQSLMLRHGPPAVFFGRFLPVMRLLAAFLAGVSAFSYPKFFLYNVLGGVTWATAVGSVGFLFGHQLPQIERVVRQVSWGGAGLVVLLVFSVMIGRWIQRYKLQTTDAESGKTANAAASHASDSQPNHNSAGIDIHSHP